EPFQYKIIAMPGWITADEVTRQQIVIAAQKYLIDVQPQVRRWLGTNNYPHGDLSAYRALVLLRDVDPEAYEHLDLTVWVKWAPVVVAVPKETGTENGKYYDSIAADASAKAPAEFARTVRWLIRAERRRSRA